MTKEQAQKHVATLAEKASKADKSEDALRFSQAATNLANALCGLNAACNKQLRGGGAVDTNMPPPRHHL